MHFAALRGYDMEWVFIKVASGNGVALAEQVVKLKSENNRPLLSALLEGITRSAGPEFSGVMSTAARAINFYSTQAALRTQRDPNFDFAAFVRGKPFESSKLLRPSHEWTPFDDDYEAIGMGRHVMGVFDSVYIHDGSSESPTLPIYLEFIHRVKEAAFAYAEECRLGGHAAPYPTSLVLDELAAMPIPDLGRMLADFRDRGVAMVGGIQSLKQAVDLYGKVGEDFLTLWRHILAFKGILDVGTLKTLSDLSGTEWQEIKGWSEGRHPKTYRWEWSSSIRLEEKPRFKPEHIRMGDPSLPDAALMVRRDKHHMWVRAIPYYKGDPWLKVLVNSAEHARRDGIGLPLPPLAKNGDYRFLAELGLEQRFRALQNRRQELGGLCRSNSTWAATTLSLSTITSQTNGSEACPMHPGRCGLSAASSTTSSPGTSSTGWRTTSAVTRSAAGA